MAYPQRGCTHVCLGLLVCAFADQKAHHLQMIIEGGEVEGDPAILQREDTRRGSNGCQRDKRGDT